MVQPHRVTLTHQLLSNRSCPASAPGPGTAACIPHAGAPVIPPAGRRRLLRLPIHLFRGGSGRPFRGRLLLLIHTGRTSGRSHEVVLEVVARDRDQDTWAVASGFGPEARWYRNLRHTPR
ncbi:nitroreductase/quinone reductase family protein [Streptomyces sp. SCSIO 30461]|uniref:nitroreductase/quinone reductase family protein n=1 Tax=Streptomyces sp. SCSIO 30461 TaxID=3118085 RepID=UPI0030D0263D